MTKEALKNIKPGDKIKTTWGEVLSFVKIEMNRMNGRECIITNGDGTMKRPRFLGFDFVESYESNIMDLI